jgi:hypothetical protein
MPKNTNPQSPLSDNSILKPKKPPQPTGHQDRNDLGDPNAGEVKGQRPLPPKR